MSCIHYTERVSGNIFKRPSGILWEGKVMPRHKHNFDHTTVCMNGSLRIVPDGGEPVILQARVEQVMSPKGVLVRVQIPEEYLVKAGVEHEITALEDGTVYWCEYSHRNANGEVVQEPDLEAAYF